MPNSMYVTLRIFTVIEFDLSCPGELNGQLVSHDLLHDMLHLYVYGPSRLKFFQV